MTIVITWRGFTLARQEEQYLDHLNKMVILASQTAAGNEGLFIMKELQGELAHFLRLSFWTSEEALVKIAGATCSEVVDPSPKERSLLIAFESTARHYKVLYRSKSSPVRK